MISLAVSIALIHLFLTPLFPSPLDFFQQSDSNPLLDANSSVVSTLKAQFQSNLDGSVTYHGAPWKPEIGRWLAGCSSNSTPVDIVEVYALYSNYFKFIYLVLIVLHSATKPKFTSISIRVQGDCIYSVMSMLHPNLCRF